MFCLFTLFAHALPPRLFASLLAPCKASSHSPKPTEGSEHFLYGPRYPFAYCLLVGLCFFPLFLPVAPSGSGARTQMCFVTRGSFTESYKLCKHHGIEIKKRERGWNARYTSAALGSRRGVSQRQEEMQREGDEEQKVESSTFSICVDRSSVSLLPQKRENVSKTKPKQNNRSHSGSFKFETLSLS